MAKFRVAVEWSMYGEVEVDADTLQEAIEKVEDDLDMPLPEGEYIDDSFVVNSEFSEFLAKEKNLPIY